MGAYIPDEGCHLPTPGSQILSAQASLNIPKVALAPSGACELKINFPFSHVFFFLLLLLLEI